MGAGNAQFRAPAASSVNRLQAAEKLFSETSVFTT
jgi:hypothetical protein